MNLAVLKNIANGVEMPIDDEKELSPVSHKKLEPDTDDGMFGERY